MRSWPGCFRGSRKQESLDGAGRNAPQPEDAPPPPAEGIPTQFPRTIGPNALKYLAEIVDSGMTVDMMGRFERAFAEALGVSYCIAMPGCTPALHALMLGAGFVPGDEIIVSPITDYGTVQGFLRKT